MILADKVVAIHDALDTVPHAFGGAIALAYYAEPRATVDIDINVFVDTDSAPAVFGFLTALGIAASPADAVRAGRDGQIRLWWDVTPIDLFFSYDPFHDAARSGSREVPFAHTTIPILSVDHLVVCKATFNRPKDWVDISAILTDGTVPDTAECLRWLGRIVGDTDQRYDRLAAVLTRGTTS